MPHYNSNGAIPRNNMCIVCEYNKGKKKSLKGIKVLRCYECPHVTTIPKIKGLKELDLYECTALTTIPKITSLKYLYCYYCPIVARIPKTKKLKVFDIGACPWIPNNNEEYKDNIDSLVKAQRVAKNFLLRRRLKQITPSILKIYFHPEMKGGYFHKKKMLNWLKTV